MRITGIFQCSTYSKGEDKEIDWTFGRRKESVADEAQNGKAPCENVMGPPRTRGTFQASKFSNAKQSNGQQSPQIPYHSSKPFNSIHRIQIYQQQSAMSGRRIAYVGVPVVAIGGYYFYAAGGDTKVAQKKAERLSTGDHKTHLKLHANMI